MPPLPQRYFSHQKIQRHLLAWPLIDLPGEDLSACHHQQLPSYLLPVDELDRKSQVLLEPSRSIVEIHRQLHQTIKSQFL